ncbi:MAG: hypothetical protein GF398_08160 [Chitinivibrionales bacterium]|nr:hypothetical protein [Chitinivibrionales bacterium]
MLFPYRESFRKIGPVLSAHDIRIPIEKTARFTGFSDEKIRQIVAARKK